MRRVVVIGDALVDISVRPSKPIRPGADVPAAIQLGPGGQGANIAVRLARLGVPVELVCGLCDDPAGGYLRASLEADGVGITSALVEATGSVVILLDPTGERSMLSHRSPFTALLGDTPAGDAPWLVVSGYVLLEAEAAHLLASLATRDARRVLVGCAVPADAAARWRDAAATLRPDLVVLNRSEAAALLEAMPLPGIVVTDATGATATIGDVTVEARSPGAGAALDTTGAGDAFAAMLIARLMEADWPPEDADVRAALTDAVMHAAAVAHSPGAQARVAGEPAPLATR